MTEYRFLRGAEPYKRRFADDDEPLEAVGVTRGPAGALALRALRHLPAFPTWARSRVPAAFAWGTGAAPKWGPPWNVGSVEVSRGPGGVTRQARITWETGSYDLTLTAPEGFADETEDASAFLCAALAAGAAHR